MKTKPLFLTGCLSLLSLTFMGTALAADTKGIEQALRDLDSQWSAAAAAKDVDKTVSFYSDDAIVMPANDKSATTPNAIRAVWKGLIDSATSVSWKTTKVEVAQSGDLAFVTGTYDLTTKDASGKPVNDRGKYLAVWEKQADGKWKCGADIWNSDLPAPTLPAPEKK
jgi:ketosteroid isomerase-like protein